MSTDHLSTTPNKIRCLTKTSVSLLRQRASAGLWRCQKKTRRRQDLSTKRSTCARWHTKLTELMSSRMAALVPLRTSSVPSLQRASRKHIWVRTHQVPPSTITIKRQRSRLVYLWRKTLRNTQLVKSNASIQSSLWGHHLLSMTTQTKWALRRQWRETVPSLWAVKNASLTLQSFQTCTQVLSLKATTERKNKSSEIQRASCDQRQGYLPFIDKI